MKNNKEPNKKPIKRSTRKPRGEKSIISYVAEKIKKGVSGDEIKKQLHSVGWSDNEVDEAYAAGLVKCGIPLPFQGDEKFFSRKSTVAEIVLNIFSFIVLGFISISLGSLLFEVINYHFKDSSIDPLFVSRVVSSAVIHYAIAVLVIGFPLYYFSMRFWFQRFRADEGKIESRLTKWITYLVLLIVAATAVGDLIAVLFNFLQGETSVRFFLKALVVFVISGGVFGFYFLERRMVQYKKVVVRETFQIFGLVTAIVILISIILGFLVAGSPSTERKRTFDEDRVLDLESISNCVSLYANRYSQMPDSLKTLEAASLYCSREYKDPETRQPYEYRVISVEEKEGGLKEGEFELCATFSMKADEDSVRKRSVYYDNETSKWEVHEVGRSCDTEKVIISNENNSGCGF